MKRVGEGNKRKKSPLVDIRRKKKEEERKKSSGEDKYGDVGKKDGYASFFCLYASTR